LNINKWYNLTRNFFERKSIVLAYHRVAETTVDPWELAVSPKNFEQQLQVLSKLNVIPISELVIQLRAKSILSNSVCLTFDDGYSDNYSIAKPLLEKYKIPATFFISSVNIGTDKEFWWDELENIFLIAERLPAFFNLTIEGTSIEFHLKGENVLNDEIRNKHKVWKACTDPPPTLRSQLFLLVWQKLKILTHTRQHESVTKIRAWAGIAIAPRSEYRSISVEELRQLSSSNFVTIGVHTVNHPALSYHSEEYQKKELLDNRKFLEGITGKEISLLAYPHGDFNKETLAIASGMGFNAAFTTKNKVIRSNSPKFRLGRVQMTNITNFELAMKLKNWRIS
jgi:peptidoglycan/xylan/chitin deacetylase (PgdA/CDA1 family)